MKKLITVSILLSSMLMFGNTLAMPHSEATSNVATQEVATKVFSIEKMTCKMCNITIRKAMEKVDIEPLAETTNCTSTNPSTPRLSARRG